MLHFRRLSTSESANHCVAISCPRGRSSRPSSPKSLRNLGVVKYRAARGVAAAARSAAIAGAPIAQDGAAGAAAQSRHVFAGERLVVGHQRQHLEVPPARGALVADDRGTFRAGRRIHPAARGDSRRPGSRSHRGSRREDTARSDRGPDRRSLLAARRASGRRPARR